MSARRTIDLKGAIYQTDRIDSIEETGRQYLMAIAERGVSCCFCGMAEYQTILSYGIFEKVGVLLGFPFGGCSAQTILEHLSIINQQGVSCAKLTIGSRELSSGKPLELERLILLIDQQARKTKLELSLEIPAALLTLEQLEIALRFIAASSAVRISISTGTSLDTPNPEQLHLVQQMLAPRPKPRIAIPLSLARDLPEHPPYVDVILGYADGEAISRGERA